MTFEEILDQAIAMLRQRGRFSLENSGFSRWCCKAMEWLADDTTHFHYSL